MKRRLFFRKCGVITTTISLCPFENFAIELDGNKITPTKLSEGQYIVKNEIVRVDLNKADFLKSVNTAAKINYTLGKKKSKLKVLIIHSNSGYKAFENRCTHGGMELKYLTDTEELRCTSFGHSRFDLNGNVRKGPASKNLKILKLSQEDQSLIIYK